MDTVEMEQWEHVLLMYGCCCMGGGGGGGGEHKNLRVSEFKEAQDVYIHTEKKSNN